MITLRPVTRHPVLGHGPCIGCLVGALLLLNGCTTAPDSFVTLANRDAATSNKDGGVDAAVQYPDAAARDAAVSDADSSMVSPGDAAVDAGLPGPMLRQFVGLVPAAAPQLDDASVPTSGVAELEAELEVLALGSRAVWFEALPTSVLGLSRLEQRQDVYRQTGVQLLVNVPLDEIVVEPFVVPDMVTTQRYQSLIQAILSAHVTPSYLTFGRALDVALDALSDSDADAAAEWVGALMQYAESARGLAPTRVGISGSPAGWLAPSVAFARLDQVAEVAGVSWLVVGPTGEALSPQAAVKEFDGLVQAVARKVVVFQDVAYPSAKEVGSSEAQQDAFYSLFLERLPEHDSRVPFVSIAAVNEYPDATCESYATHFGLPELAKTAWCSVGLRRHDGSKKPGYDTVAQALARFSAF